MKIFGKNYVEDTSLVNVSSGDATKANLYDRNTSSQWASVGSNDLIGEAVSIWYPAFKTFDHICLRNINLDSYRIMYFDTGMGMWVDFSPVISVTGNTDESVIHSFTQITTTNVILTSQTTFPADDEKRIGEFMCYQELIDLEDEWLPDTHEPVYYTKKHEHEKANGGNLIIIENMNPKYQNNWEFETLPEDLVDDLYDLKLTHQSVWVLPDENQLLDQYYVNWVNDFNFKKIIAWTPAGTRCYSGNIEVKEV